MGTARRAKKETLIEHITNSDRSATYWRRAVSFVSDQSKRKWFRISVWAFFAVIIFIIVGQLLYPRDRGLPFAYVSGKSLAWATQGDMAKAITAKFEESKVKLTLGSDKSVEYKLAALGAEPNTEEMIKQLTGYPLWQRFIPGSILWQPSNIKTASIFYTTDALKKFSDDRAKELTFPPQNARLAIEKDVIVASNAMAGSEVKSSELIQAINRSQMTLGGTTTFQIPAKRTKADRSLEDLAKVRGEAEAALAHIVTIKAGDQTFTPDKAERASWILLNVGEKGTITLSADKGKITTYLDELNKKVGTPAGQTDIQIVDGREASRTTGALGRGINVSGLVDQLAASMLGKSGPIAVTAEFVDIQPSVIFNSRYTATQAGLQAFLNDIARNRNMHISIQQLDGAGWHAAARENESIPSGSTYKLYVSLVLFDRINKGEIHWDDPMLDTTVAGCFERMTVASTNPCAEKWIAMFGREYINNFIYNLGFSTGTSFTTGSATQTTATDLSKFMTGLNDGTLVSGANRDRLLDSLGRHPYRYGIPTGSAGVVHDKVGFLWDYVHDTAIVQHPRGTYIMTIMTKGQSYAAIATATREIERIMFP